MKVTDLIAKLQAMPQDRSVHCQVVGAEPGGGVWSMFFDVHNVEQSDWLIQLRVWHREMPHLPVIETCDSGHKYAKLPDHPLRDGRPRCPHCMAIGLDAARTPWQHQAYAKLGSERDRMPPEAVKAVQNFLGPLQ